MKARARRASRLAASWCGLCLGALLITATYAQTTAAPAAAGPAPPAAPPAAPAYQDRYIAGGNLAPDISAGDYTSSTDGGLARSIRIDGVMSYLEPEGPGAAPATREDGFILDAQWDTQSWGAWSADGGVRTPDSTRPGVDEYGNASFSLHQRGMPFDGGWLADNALGDINTPLIDLARQQPRFILAPGPMQGFDTVWHGPSGLEIVAGGGEPGIFDGIKIPLFDPLGGSTGTLGAQWAMAPQWTMGGEIAAARDTPLYFQPTIPGLPASAGTQRLDSTTGYLTAAWQDGPSRAQLNLIDGTLDGNGNSLGAWLDASHTSGPITQSYGLFRIDPNLAWGNQLMTSDAQGGYYRVDYQSRRWVADFDIDQVNSVSNNGGNTTFITTDARYQLTRDLGIGGVANFRHGSGDDAWSLAGYLDQANSLGTGRGELDYASDSQTTDATATLQQTWKVPAGERLSTAVSVDRITSSANALLLQGAPLQQDATIVRLDLYGGGDLTARLSANATVQWAETVQGNAAPSRSADVSLAYQISRSWSVIGDYYENRVGSWTQLVITSPLTPPTASIVPWAGERGVFLTVRFQEASGAHFVPLGGAPGSGSGRLSGLVYLDANENGRYDAGEAGAANITVILDGRYSVRTDANGHYVFPAVAAGRHVITVQADNLPLPWTLTNSGRTEVDLVTRGSAEVDIGAVRIK
jgi:SdrD B-like domain